MLDYYSKDSSNSSGKNIVRESKSGLFGLERKHRENCKQVLVRRQKSTSAINPHPNALVLRDRSPS
jgi:hypothetical protein